MGKLNLTNERTTIINDNYTNFTSIEDVELDKCVHELKLVTLSYNNH